jgi:D-arabinose 1-dehydrogenase-like Zn-dependent alcohol dehydrogenase
MHIGTAPDFSYIYSNENIASDQNKSSRYSSLWWARCLQIQEIALPIPSQGQFLIEVDAASVNPVDHKIRTGKYKMFRPKLPAIIGRDIAGTIRAVGAATNGSLKSAM